MELVFKLENIDEAAVKFIAATAGHRVIAFHGEMGAGKTTFIHAVCEAMGVKENISSPTFAIINQYATAAGKTIYHMDWYRIKDDEEAINAGVEDCLYSGNTCFVEWPEKARGVLPDDTLHVVITMIGDATRKIQIP